MVFLKRHIAPIFITVLFSGCTPRSIDDIIKEQAYNKHLDKYSTILSSQSYHHLFPQKKSTITISLKDHIHYIKIRFFDHTVAETIRTYLKKNPISHGIVLDLRHNNGGYLDEAIKVVDLFISEGMIIKEQQNHTAIPYFATQHTIIPHHCPIVILIDHKSASASEIVAGSLQFHKRAFIIGKRSYGKGTVQTMIPLDHKVLKLTTAHYTIGHTTVEGKGIIPGIIIDDQIKHTNPYRNIILKYKYVKHQDKSLLIAVDIAKHLRTTKI